MKAEAPRDLTQLLVRYREGDAEAFERLVDTVYDQLKVIARGQLRKTSGLDTLNTTALVSEAYLKLSAGERAAWNDRGHFFAVSARAMRQILVDHARRRGRAKRGGDTPHVPLEDERHAVGGEVDRLLALEDALRRLEEVDPRAVRVIECRYFMGLSEAETAQALELSARTVQRLWQRSRQWLARELG